MLPALPLPLPPSAIRIISSLRSLRALPPTRRLLPPLALRIGKQQQQPSPTGLVLLTAPCPGPRRPPMIIAQSLEDSTERTSSPSGPAPFPCLGNPAHPGARLPTTIPSQCLSTVMPTTRMQKAAAPLSSSMPPATQSTHDSYSPSRGRRRTEVAHRPPRQKQALASTASPGQATILDRLMAFTDMRLRAPCPI